MKSILFIMFANLKLVLRSYTSLYGIFMSACLTLFIYTVRQIADYDLWNGDNVWTLYSISCEVHGITFSHYAWHLYPFLAKRYQSRTAFLGNVDFVQIWCRYSKPPSTCFSLCFTSQSTIVQSCGDVLLEPVLCREDYNNPPWVSM